MRPAMGGAPGNGVSQTEQGFYAQAGEGYHRLPGGTGIRFRVDSLV